MQVNIVAKGCWAAGDREAAPRVLAGVFPSAGDETRIAGGEPGQGDVRRDPTHRRPRSRHGPKRGDKADGRSRSTPRRDGASDSDGGDCMSFALKSTRGGHAVATGRIAAAAQAR